MSFLDFVKQKVELVGYISELTEVVPVGELFQIFCPFHPDEKTRSLIIYPDTQSWYCFGCAKGGDLINFVEMYYNCSFQEAVRMLAEKYDIKIPRADWEEYKFREMKRQKLLMQLEDCKKMLFAPENIRVLNYLVDDRGLSVDIIKEFELGYDKLKNSIKIPLKDKFSKLVGLVDRFLDDQQIKYKNPENDDLYQKKSLLYNLGDARRYVKDKIYVLEGYFDVMSMVQAGYKNSVAVCGDHLTKEQMLELKSVLKEDVAIVLVPDNDHRKIDFIQKSRDCIRTYVDNRILVLLYTEEVKDINEYYLKFKTDNFQYVDVDKFLIDNILQSEEDLELQYKKIKKVLEKVTNLLVREDLICYLTDKLNKSPDVMRQYFFGASIDTDFQLLKTIEEVAEDYEKYVSEDIFAKVPFGYRKLDNSIRGGMVPGELAYFVARTGVGKTAFVINVIKNVVGDLHIPTIFYSLEQPREQIFERVAGIIGKIPTSEVENLCRAQNQEYIKLLSKIFFLLDDLLIVDKAGLSLDQIADLASKASLFKFSKPVKFVVIDYLALISGFKGDRYERTSNLSVELKNFAKNLNVAVLCIHQLTRQAGEGDLPVTMTMCRDSGVIEESADYLFAAYRPDIFKKEEKEEQDFVIQILKNRKGKAPLSFALSFVPTTLEILDTVDLF